MKFIDENTKLEFSENGLTLTVDGKVTHFETPLETRRVNLVHVDERIMITPEFSADPQNVGIISVDNPTDQEWLITLVGIQQETIGLPITVKRYSSHSTGPIRVQARSFNQANVATTPRNIQDVDGTFKESVLLLPGGRSQLTWILNEFGEMELT